VTEGLLAYGGGSKLVVGVAAGIGTMALLIRSFSEDARNAEESIQKLLDTTQKVSSLGKVGLANEGISRIRSQGSGFFSGNFFGLNPGGRGFFQSGEDFAAKSQDKINQLVIVGASFKKMSDAEHLAALDKEQAKLEARYNYAVAHPIDFFGKVDPLLRGPAASAGMSVTASGGSLLEMAKAAAAAGANFNQPWYVGGPGASTQNTSKASVVGSAAALNQAILRTPLEATAKASMTASDRLQFLSSSILLLGSAAGASGSRFSQFLMGSGGLIAQVPGGQVAGAAIGLAGAVIGLFGGGSKPLPVQVTNPDDIGRKRNQGPERVSYIVVSQDGKVLPSAQYEIRRRARLRGERAVA
jgi:hypothetical protein